MEALWKVGASLLTAIVLAACGGVPVKQAAAVQEDTCPSVLDKNALARGGHPDEWRREYREPATAWKLYKCSKLQPLIEWAKSSSNHESYAGGCEGSYSSFTCKSERGPSGTSPRGRQWRSEGNYLELAIAVRTAPACTDAASVRRYLYVTVDYDGKWRYRAESDCYW